MSQLDLALEAEISQKHLSFVESGRSTPSREMVLRLADGLDVPKREQNSLLVAAGYAPVFRERSLRDPSMEAVRAAVEHVLDAHVPYPALAVDRHWTMLAANRVVPLLLGGAKAELLAPPVNVLRLSLHPAGLAPRIVNLREWRRHVLERLKRQATTTGDQTLVDLLRELSAYAEPMRCPEANGAAGAPDVFVPLRLATNVGVLELISTTTLFGTPLDVTVSEIAIEAFLPATPETGRMLSSMVNGSSRSPSGPSSAAG